MTEINKFSDRIVHWVDAYLRTYRHIPWWIFTIIFLVSLALGAGAHWSYQHIAQDTYQAGYQARELQQFENTYTDSNMLIELIEGQRVDMTPLNPDLSRGGRTLTRVFCPGYPLRWKAGEVVTVTWEWNPKGNNGEGCENVNYPQLGFRMWRDPNTLQSVNLFSKGNSQ